MVTSLVAEQATVEIKFTAISGQNLNPNKIDSDFRTSSLNSLSCTLADSCLFKTNF